MIKLAPVFSTSETLEPRARMKIEEVLGAPVFDQYSLNDSGLSAIECHRHDGYHIDSERSVLECVDESGTQINRGEGRLLGTALYNYAMPFIRYDTGDFAALATGACACGDPRPRLSSLLGRTIELLDIDGTKIGWAALTPMLRRVPVIQYQIVQETSRRVVFRLVTEDTYSREDEDIIRSFMVERCPTVELVFDYPCRLKAEGAEKLKFIVNRHRSERGSSQD